MSGRKYIKKRVYRVRQKLGGLEVILRYPLSGAKVWEVPDQLSLCLAGKANGRLRTECAELPAEKFLNLLQLGEDLSAGDLPEPGAVLSWQGAGSPDKIWFLELRFLESEEPLRKPWEFRMYTAEGGREMLLSVPICVRLSSETLKKMMKAVKAEGVPIPVSVVGETLDEKCGEKAYSGLAEKTMS